MTRPTGADPRIHIWGTLEARLQSADLLILGGLDEKVWPAETRTDPWLSRAMRTEVGLPPPERRIGLAAHDFAEAFAAPRVILTRAAKRGGAPTVASRWLQRLFALAGEDAIAADADARRPLRGARPRHRPARTASRSRCSGPRPRPPVEHRPRRLSVTEIETAGPRPLRDLRQARPPPASRSSRSAWRRTTRCKGNLIHDALGTFGQEWTGAFDAAAEARLLEIGRAALAEIADFADTHAVWEIRFEAMAHWFDRMGRRSARPRSPRAMPRSTGKLELAAPAGPFTLRGRADRIDLRRDGRVEVLDFKTGTPPSARQVLRRTSPRSSGSRRRWCGGGAFGEAFAGRSLASLFWIGAQHGRARTSRSRTPSRRADGRRRRRLRRSPRFAALIAAFDDPERGLRLARPADVRNPLRKPL